MNDFTVKETTVWGKHKQFILQTYPIIDHYKIYALKERCQRGPVRDSQTFLVSYAYNYDAFIGLQEEEFRTKLDVIPMQFYKEPCIYQGKDAYKIIVYDSEVILPLVLDLLAE